MSSGFGPDDTYAIFSRGGGVVNRRHDWDASHFSIYKKGYLPWIPGCGLPYRTRQLPAHDGGPQRRSDLYARRAIPVQPTGPVIANTGGQNSYPQHARRWRLRRASLRLYRDRCHPGV